MPTSTPHQPNTKVYSFKDFSDTMHEMSALKLADCRDVADLGLRLKDLNDKLLTMAGGAGEPTADVHLIMNFIQNLGPRYRLWKEELLRGHRLVSDIPQDPTVLRFNDVFVKALMQEQVFERVDRALEGEPVIDITDDPETSAEGMTMKQRQDYADAQCKLRDDPNAPRKLTEDDMTLEERAAKRSELEAMFASSRPRLPVGKNGQDISEPLARTKASMAAKMHEAMKQLEAFKQMQLDQQEPAASTTTTAKAAAITTKNKAKGKQEQKQTQTPIQNTPAPAINLSLGDQADSTELLKSVEAAANAAESAARRHADMLRSFMASTSTGQNGRR